jgi:hypothetical protein
VTYWNGFAYDQTLSVLVHAHSKVGKTWFGATTPAPRLILDAEGGTNWLPSEAEYRAYGVNPCYRTKWDPQQGPPPTPDGTWDTCVVTIREYRTIELVYQWLVSGQHSFRSVTLDSISEVQKRAKDNMVGIGTMRQQDWGDLLTHMEALIRNFRDLTLHPVRPVQAVVLVAFTKEQNGRHEAYVQGQLKTTMPYFLDVIGYLYPHIGEDGILRRRMLVSPDPLFEAGERVGGRLGSWIEQPNVERMLYQVYGMAPPDHGALYVAQAQPN